MRRRTRALFGALVILGLGGLGLGLSVWLRRPSFDHSYRLEQSKLPVIEIAGRRIRIQHVRTFRYASDGTPIPGWADRRYDLDRLVRVWFGISPFARGWRGPAHTFLSFEFKGGRFLAVSVEARKEEGEEYSALKGLLRQYELMYVIADEPDLVGLRAVTWHDRVYLYPGRATPDQARRLLMALLHRASEVEKRPEFYNTLTDNCTTNLARAINEVTPGRVRWSYALEVPGYSDALALRLGLLDTDLPLEAARARYRVDERARALPPVDSAAFSTRIRGG